MNRNRNFKIIVAKGSYVTHRGTTEGQTQCGRELPKFEVLPDNGPVTCRRCGSGAL